MRRGLKFLVKDKDIPLTMESITHADSPDELVRKGRDIERRVLAEAVRLFLEERVLLNDQRTVVFKG